jgi:hypothetical protein
VFPLSPGCASEQIGGTRLNDHRVTLPAAIGFAPQAKVTGREERNADDILEYALVTVPANGRTRTVLGDQCVWEVSGFEAGEGRRAFADREQERRNLAGGVEPGLVEVIVPTVGEDAAPGEITLEFEFL